MCHGRGMRDQTLNSAQRFGEGETLETVDESFNGSNPAGNLEAHHGSETVLLFRGNGMSGMIRQSRIVNRLDLLVVAEDVDHPSSILAVGADPRMKSPDSAQRQKTVERRAGNSEAVRPPGELFDQRRI